MMRSIRGGGSQAGSALLEGLFAILIFSMGVLALVGLQANSVKQSTGARHRTDASLLANELIGKMWAANRNTLQADFSSPNGTAYAAWVNEVKASLPGVESNPPAVSIDPASGMVTIRISWQPPNESSDGSARNHIVKAQIN